MLNTIEQLIKKLYDSKSITFEEMLFLINNQKINLKSSDIPAIIPTLNLLGLQPDKLNNENTPINIIFLPPIIWRPLTH